MKVTLRARTAYGTYRLNIKADTEGLAVMVLSGKKTLIATDIKALALLGVGAVCEDCGGNIGERDNELTCSDLSIWRHAS